MGITDLFEVNCKTSEKCATISLDLARTLNNLGEECIQTSRNSWHPTVVTKRAEIVNRMSSEIFFKRLEGFLISKIMPVLHHHHQLLHHHHQLHQEKSQDKKMFSNNINSSSTTTTTDALDSARDRDKKFLM